MHPPMLPPRRLARLPFLLPLPLPLAFPRLRPSRQALLTPPAPRSCLRATRAARVTLSLHSLRSLHTSPIFSPDQPRDLPARVAALPKWRLSPSRKGLTRSFTFASFASAWAFMDRVAAECKRQRHHPEWSNLYNRVTVEWTTHRPEGLSIKDVHMAEFCDNVAAEIGVNE